MTTAAKRWTSRLIKLAVCGVALWYLSTKVTLEDYARLAASPREKHIILSESRSSDGTLQLTIRDARTGEHRIVRGSELASQETLTAIAKDHRPIEKGLKSVVFEADWSWTAWSLIAFAPVTFILGWRLQCLLRTQEIRLGYRESLLLTFAGNFFNFPWLWGLRASRLAWHPPPTQTRPTSTNTPRAISSSATASRPRSATTTCCSSSRSACALRA